MINLKYLAMQKLMVSTSLFEKNVIDATTESIVENVECYVHVWKDGTISWSRYTEGEILSADAYHVGCNKVTGIIFDSGGVPSASDDIRELIRLQPDIYLTPMKTELGIKVWDSMTQIEWEG